MVPLPEVRVDGGGPGADEALRAALALTTITGKAFEVADYGRERPRSGFGAESLAWVRAAAALSAAEVEGAEEGGTRLAFRPATRPAGGDHVFDLGSAGPISLLLETLAPALVLDGEGRLRLVVGSPGGSRIPAIVAAAIVNHLDHGADVWTALALGRVHHQHRPDVTFVEPFAVAPATATALRIRGHVLHEEAPWGNATAVAIDPGSGVRTGAADPRGAGAAVAE